jgi:hypothetical protein
MTSHHSLTHLQRSTSSAAQTHRYDPWRDLHENWPEVEIVIEPMDGNLLGEVRDGGRLIALREGTSSGQRRCTLAHEIVHLERGLHDCGPWQGREEALVHAEVALRLIPIRPLADSIRILGGDDAPSALAQILDVDLETLQVRQRLLTSAERKDLRRWLGRQRDLWSVA